MSDWRPDIFTFLSFRAYLKAYYEAAKANTRHFSYRYFAKRAGFASSNFLKLVMDGQRNVSPTSVDKIAEAVGLTAEEHRFLAHLVLFEQADSESERARHLRAITATRRFWEARPLDGMMFQYLSSWHNVAVRELAARRDFEADPAWIAANLVPAISAVQAAESLKLLIDLGLLVQDTEGRVTRGEPTLDSGHEVTAIGVREFHRQMIERGRDAMDHTPARLRDISAMTVCVREDQLAAIKQRLRAFREEMMDFCDSQHDPGVVLQINIQAFPLSSVKGEEGA